ncbi:metallophosphatase family protein [bacterium]|nr:metallophosphatase family protein [bacterium]
MDRIAVISDIHGNIPALEAVLADIDQRGIDTIYCLGDIVGKGPNSALALDICRERCLSIVSGNWDDAIIGDADQELFVWHRERLGTERLNYLKNLPNTVDFTMSGRRIRLFHASNQGVHHRVFPYKEYEILMEMFVNTEFTGFNTHEPDIVGYGDIHVAYYLGFFTNRKKIFNAGSVGCPLDEPQATYTILEGYKDEKIQSHFSITQLRIPYDVELAVTQAKQADIPELESYIVELRTAEYRGLQK